MTSGDTTASKIVLLVCSILFLVSGAGLLVVSALLLADTPRVLLSRLLVLGPKAQHARYPPFYYASLVIGGAGLLVCAAALLACWAACQRGRALLGTLIGVLATLLLGQAALVVLGSTLPAGQSLIVALEPAALAEALQRNFGAPGNEQFTAAFDLAQFRFKCCGVLGPGDYETSWWRMQELGGRELRVPLTCCYLDNPPGEAKAFLDPVPRNTSLCQQASAKETYGERFHEGCLRSLEVWFTTQWGMAAGAVAGLVCVQLAVFASAIVLCRRMPSRLS